MGDRHADGARERRGVANLPGPALVRPVQDGLAVKPDQIRALPEFFDRRDVRLGHATGQVGDDRIAGGQPGGAIENRAKIGAQRRRIGQGRRRPDLSHALAVGLDPGGVHAIQRRPAHQPDRPQHFHPVSPMLARLT